MDWKMAIPRHNSAFSHLLWLLHLRESSQILSNPELHSENWRTLKRSPCLASDRNPLYPNPHLRHWNNLCCKPWHSSPNESGLYCCLLANLQLPSMAICARVTSVSLTPYMGGVDWQKDQPISPPPQTRHLAWFTFCERMNNSYFDPSPIAIFLVVVSDVIMS